MLHTTAVIANIIQIYKMRNDILLYIWNDLSQPFRLAWNLRPILTPRRCRWAISVAAFQAEWFGRILATSLSGSSQSLKGSYRYSLWHRHRLIGESHSCPSLKGSNKMEPSMSPCEIGMCGNGTQNGATHNYTAKHKGAVPPPRRCHWTQSVTAFQAERFGRILATSLSGAFPSLKGSYRYSLWHRHRLIGTSPLMTEPERLEQNETGHEHMWNRDVR